MDDGIHRLLGSNQVHNTIHLVDDLQYLLQLLLHHYHLPNMLHLPNKTYQMDTACCLNKKGNNFEHLSIPLHSNFQMYLMLVLVRELLVLVRESAGQVQGSPGQVQRSPGQEQGSLAREQESPGRVPESSGRVLVPNQGNNLPMVRLPN